MSHHPPIEIERKYLVRMPSLDALRAMEDYAQSDIEQIYLASPDGSTHRIRRRTLATHTQYTETVKQRIDARRAYEDEHEIDEQEYARLKAERDPTRRVICKVRHTFVYKNQLFEVDVYPFWSSQCVVETELSDPNAAPPFPACLTVLREVSEDRRYSNAALSHQIPDEEIDCKN